ncbi:MAG: ABC transporter ATP-binding protein, partial [Oscillospiraceae bacterium]|nr:ABC transporter ATP-binding protein [Oscillospiraceae bacterium]
MAQNNGAAGVLVSTGKSSAGGIGRFTQGQKAKDPRGTFRRLLRFYLEQGRAIFAVAALLLVQTILGVTAPWLIGKTVDEMRGGVRFDAVHTLVLVLLAVYGTSWLIDLIQGMLMNAASQRIVYTMRRALFDKFQTLPLAYHDSQPHGELMSRMTNDIDNISRVIATCTTSLVSAGVTLLGSLVIMLYLSRWMTLAVLIIVPLVWLVTRIAGTHCRRLFGAQQAELGRLNGITEETISGQKIVKAFDREEQVIRDFAAVNRRLQKVGTSAFIWAGILMPMINAISNIGYLSVAVVGGLLMTKSLISVGTVATFITYSRQIAHPLNNLAGVYNNLQSALAGAERIFEVMDEADEPEDEPDAVELTTFDGHVRFEDVSFAYTPGKDVIRHISFEAQPGQKIALVGATGAGKTTVVNLLTRFYDVSNGAVYLDGVDIRHYRRDSLRREFSVVLQDTCLFTGTIADNIRYGYPEATEEEVVAAAKASGAHEFIMRLSDGYQTQVSGSSNVLSQGQRQLIAISRAVLCRAPILILDEATSSVDTRTELRIQAAMMNLVKGSTSFVIAHRLSTIRDADLILVMRDGQIVERGTHQELLAL